jgi:guanylate kinase
MIAGRQFLEWADVFGNYYGTARSALSQAAEHGRDLILDIDVQGAMQVMERVPEAVSIFIMPPGPHVLETRLRNRSAAEHMTDETVIERRLRQARGELGFVSRYQFAIVNDVLDTAAAELRAIVLQARGDEEEAAVVLAGCCRTADSPARLQSVLDQFASSAFTT